MYFTDVLVSLMKEGGEQTGNKDSENKKVTTCFVGHEPSGVSSKALKSF